MNVNLRNQGTLSAPKQEPPPPSTLPTSGQWHLLHTKSRQEKLLADELFRMGITHYLPVAKHIRVYGKRKIQVELPLFPGYVFLRGNIEDAFQASRTHRVARIITVADQNRLTWELTNLDLAFRNNAPLDPYPYLRQGVRVEVRSGPLQGLQGFIESKLNSGQLVIQIEMLGRAVVVEVAGASLEPI